MYFDITDFRLFVNVADTSSLTRGAERTFLSVPAASNRIKHLEERLQLRLLDRSPQRVVLTEAGRAYLNGARHVLSQLDVLSAELQQFSNGLSGQLRLQANTTAVTEYLPPVLGRFLKVFTDVHVDMRERMSDEIVRNVREGMAEIGVISGSVITDGVESVPFVSSQLMLITPPDHPLLSREHVYFKDTLDYPFVALMEGAASNGFYARAAAALNKQITIRVQVAGTDAIVRMVEAGAGIALVPKACIARLTAHISIGVRDLSDPWSIREFRVCAREFAELSPIAREFATMLVDEYRQTPNGAPANF
ncbi:LysR family transcriptional regulator [Cupriavidus numazuensis]|uniref:HTH-type transcriptional regulator CysL n=1 Tax=Cupriavidus numazuensis TaxID=221992 RepID=A0ABM8TLU8_9BURK|nr:LysR family transcriptional regulator [Cupriavidus numazuensis]CAG2153278.1 HTH-type transcriptional regulator CysL [Cupriavidus numazuensis]